MNKLYILFVIITIFVFGCSKKEPEVSTIKESSQELEMISSYNEAYKALIKGDPYFAAKKFLEAEILYPQSLWASRSALMASYSYYMQNFYTESISNLERYLKTYPNDKNLPYAHYLMAMCYYESIIDEKRDSGAIVKAKDKFNFVVKNYPSSEFALDASFKLDLIQDILASKEMYIGRHYIKKGKWIAAINRFKTVATDYDQTVFIEEALHRLVEIYYKIGLEIESRKYAVLLGYNYPESKWYENTYKVHKKDYKVLEIKKENKKSTLEKLKSLLD